MKTKTSANKLISALLTVVVTLGLFTAYPLMALADPAAPTITHSPKTRVSQWGKPQSLR